jgi:hypothetical protein
MGRRRQGLHTREAPQLLTIKSYDETHWFALNS